MNATVLGPSPDETFPEMKKFCEWYRNQEKGEQFKQLVFETGDVLFPHLYITPENVLYMEGILGGTQSVDFLGLILHTPNTEKRFKSLNNGEFYKTFDKPGPRSWSW